MFYFMRRKLLGKSIISEPHHTMYEKGTVQSDLPPHVGLRESSEKDIKTYVNYKVLWKIKY